MGTMRDSELKDVTLLGAGEILAALREGRMSAEELVQGCLARIRADEPRVDPEPAREALEALEGLPFQQREAVVLTKLEGKSVAEAAAIAGTTVGAMKVRAHRGYEALRKLLGRKTDRKAS